MDSSVASGGLDEDGHCRICGILHEDETDEIEQWIACDKCSTWYHWKCVDVVVEPDSFVCIVTVNNVL